MTPEEKLCGERLETKDGNSLPCHRLAGHIGDHQAGWLLLEGYQCPRCGRVSHHPKDLAKRYCGACQLFEDSP